MVFFIGHRIFPFENNLPDVVVRQIMHAPVKHQPCQLFFWGGQSSARHNGKWRCHRRARSDAPCQNEMLLTQNALMK
jgi:hypothetical protein